MDNPNKISRNGNSLISAVQYIPPYIEVPPPRLIVASPIKSPIVFRITPQPAKAPQPITLYPYQEEHVYRLSSIFQNNCVALDFSDTGRGKTFVASALGTYYKFPIILIATKTLFSVWKKVEENHGVIIEDKISYALLRGIRGKKCNHPYLILTPDNKFLPTQHLISVIDEGRLFVFDEMSKLKNRNCQSRRAAHAIIKTIVTRRTKSRVLLLSAFPSSEQRHVLTLTQLLGIVHSDTFVEYNKSTKRYNLTGIQEVINWCYQVNPTLVREIISQHSTASKQGIQEMGAELYRHIISDRLSSCMPADNSVDIRNGYYPIEKDSLEILKKGQKVLRGAVHYRNKDGSVSLRTVNWGMVTKGIKLLGKSKLRIIAKMAKVYMTSNPSSKGVIGVWFVSHIKWLAEALKEYGTETFYGQTKMKERPGVLERFQDPNSSSRIIIINPTVGGMGISLDDQDGNHPRWMLLMPDYRIMDLVQCTGRVDRKSTISKDETMIRFVYTNAFKSERRILASLQRKSDKARIVVSDKSGVRLPDSYLVDNQIKVLPEFTLPPLPDPEEIEVQGSPKNNIPILRI